MRLDQVYIDDYGPLETPRLDFSDGVEVVYGPNESGKTLLVDPLLFMLTGQNDDDRVGQSPIGYVRVDEGDTIHRLDDGETVLDRLEDHHDIVLRAREFRNTFVVRSADSELSNEDEYYDRATDVVAESLVEDIDRVQDAIQDRGRITPTGILIDQQDEKGTRTHHRTADSLRNGGEPADQGAARAAQRAGATGGGAGAVAVPGSESAGDQRAGRLVGGGAGPGGLSDR